jgi:hypothetical protein
MPNPKIELDIEQVKAVTGDEAHDLTEEKINEFLGDAGKEGTDIGDEEVKGEKDKGAGETEQPTAEELEAKRKTDEAAALALTTEIQDRATKEGKTVEDMRPIVEKERADKIAVEEQRKKDEEAAQADLETRIKARAEKDGTTEEEARTGVEEEDRLAREKDEEENKVYAGELKGRKALVDGVLAKGKALGYREKVLQLAVDTAKRSGDYAALEQMYGEFKTEDQERVETAAAEAQRREQEQQAVIEKESKEVPTETDAEKESRIKEVIRATYDEITRQEVGQEFRAAELELPRTQEELAELRKSDPGLWFMFTQAYKQTYALLDKAVTEHRAASLRLPKIATAVKDGELKKIMGFAKEFGLDTVKEEDVKALIEQTYKDPANTESRSGVPYPVAGRAYQRFLNEHLDTALRTTRASAEMRGRVQHEKDLQEMDHKTVKTISTAPIPATKRTEKKKVDVTDREAVAGMTEQEIDQLLQTGTPK